MAVKKQKTTKKQSSKKEKTTEIPKQVLDQLTFKTVKEGATDDEVLECYQHNIQLLKHHSDLLVANTLLDNEKEVIAAVARLTLMEKKMIAMAIKINPILAKKQEAKQAEVDH